MTLQFVREVLARRPFQPVRIVLADGAFYEVRRPDMALLTCSHVLVGTGAAADGVPEDFRILSLPQIAAVEPIESERSTPTPTTLQRVPDLHAGAMSTSEDFDAPLPDEFWTGQP